MVYTTIFVWNDASIWKLLLHLKFQW